MTYGGAFYTNVCRLLSSLNGGIVHRRPSVRVPLSKVGLELSQLLTNLGLLRGVSVAQRLERVRGHGRLWDPATPLRSSADAAGYPGMTLTLHINWERHRPLYAAARPAAVGPPVSRDAGGGASSSAAHGGIAGCSPAGGAVVSTPGFSHPMSVNGPTPESITLLSRPSVQRWTGLAALRAARAQARPGIYLLSTPHGLLTDIDCELRRTGGILLAHLGLPLSHVLQLRGLLRAKHAAELAAAAPPADSGGASSGGPQPPRPARHAPLAAWDARRQAGEVVAARLQGADLGEATAYLDSSVASAAQELQQLSQQADARLQQLELQLAAWRQKQQQQQERGQQPEQQEQAQQRRRPDRQQRGDGGSRSGGRSGGQQRGGPRAMTWRPPPS